MIWKSLLINVIRVKQIKKKNPTSEQTQKPLSLFSAHHSIIQIIRCQGDKDPMWKFCKCFNRIQFISVHSFLCVKTHYMTHACIEWQKDKTIPLLNGRHCLTILTENSGANRDVWVLSLTALKSVHFLLSLRHETTSQKKVSDDLHTHIS